jgi:hypothetical protein
MFRNTCRATFPTLSNTEPATCGASTSPGTRTPSKGGRRLPAEDVQSRAPQPSGEEGLGERDLVDDLASRRVDDDRPGPEPPDALSRQHAPGGLRVGHVKADDVDLGVEAVELLEPNAQRLLLSRRRPSNVEVADPVSNAWSRFAT